MSYTGAGQIGTVEWVLIIIGILWVAGVLRKTIYVPVVIKEREKETVKNETKINENITISKSDNDKNDDYVPFEEIKD